MSDVSSDWNVISGDWEFLGGFLHEKEGGGQTTDATIIGTNPVPADSAGEMLVSVTIYQPTIGDIYYIILACSADGSGGAWVKYEYLAVNQWLVTLSTGESKTMNAVPPITDRHVVMGCIDSNGFLFGQVANSGDEHPWNDGSATAIGRYYGLKHGVVDATNGARFDDFSVEELRNGTEICTSCMCSCCETLLTKQLTLTFTSATGWAACLGGATTPLDWIWSAGAYSWDGNITINNGYGDNLFEFRLTCDATVDSGCTGQNLELQMKTQCDADCFSWCANVPVAALSHCTVDGFLLVYGPFSYPSSMLSCSACGPWTMPDTPGEFYLELTL